MPMAAGGTIKVKGGRAMGRARVATEKEVLAAVSAVMRGDAEDYIVRKSGGSEEVVKVPVKLSDRMHAA